MLLFVCTLVQLALLVFVVPLAIPYINNPPPDHNPAISYPGLLAGCFFPMISFVVTMICRSVRWHIFFCYLACCPTRLQNGIVPSPAAANERARDSADAGAV